MHFAFAFDSKEIIRIETNFTFIFGYLITLLLLHKHDGMQIFYIQNNRGRIFFTFILSNNTGHLQDLNLTFL
jgi:hypothetical protein